MKVAYVDTSCFVAVAFGERGAKALARRLATFDELIASTFLEAELRAVFAREGVAPDEDLATAVSWVVVDRPLHDEIVKVLRAGYVRGADCWHLATALYVAPDPSAMAFLTLDDRQRRVAAALGFET